jgi:hypothetical protein
LLGVSSRQSYNIDGTDISLERILLDAAGRDFAATAYNRLTWCRSVHRCRTGS